MALPGEWEGASARGGDAWLPEYEWDMDKPDSNGVALHVDQPRDQLVHVAGMWCE